MINLLHIELMKYKISKLIYTLMIYLVFMMGLLFVLGISTSGIYMFDTMNIAVNETNNALIWPGCIVVIGIWNSKVIIHELKENTIQNIIAIGVDRKKLLSAKVIFSIMYSLFFTIISTVVLDLFLIVTGKLTFYSQDILFVFDISAFVNVLIAIILISLQVFLSIAIGFIRVSISITNAVTIVLALLWSMQIDINILLLSRDVIRGFISICAIIAVFWMFRKFKLRDL